MMMQGRAGGLLVQDEIGAEAKAILGELRVLQTQIDALPGPRLHQDHDFTGEVPDLERLYGWLEETAWTPYWGDNMLLLGGRDPWIETLEMRLWDCLQRLAVEAGCELVGRGAVSPDYEELALIRAMLPEVAAAQGWVFVHGEERGLN